jgi:hypothetical protein
MPKKIPAARSKRSSRQSKRSVDGPTALDTPMPPDWWELLRVLQSNRVRFLLIGGHAVSVHSTPRLTEDLDILVQATLANGRRLHAALVEFGFGSLAPAPEEILDEDVFWQFGRKPLRVDVLTHIPAVVFADAWKRRVAVRFADFEIPVIGLDDLIANKRASGRPKDLADVTSLETARARR